MIFGGKMRIENYLSSFLTAVLIIAAIAVACLPMQAQNAQPATSAEPNVGAHFEVSTEYEKLTAGGNATVVNARLPLTPRFSFVYAQYQIPSAKAQFFFAEGEFRDKLSHILKSKSLLFNADA